jgi:hypothetical protein
VQSLSTNTTTYVHRILIWWLSIQINWLWMEHHLVTKQQSKIMNSKPICDAKIKTILRNAFGWHLWCTDIVSHIMQVILQSDTTCGYRKQDWHKINTSRNKFSCIPNCATGLQTFYFWKWGLTFFWFSFCQYFFTLPSVPYR